MMVIASESLPPTYAYFPETKSAHVAERLLNSPSPLYTSDMSTGSVGSEMSMMVSA